MLRPKEGSRLIVFLKDINLPKPDKYNTIQLVSFLHQIVIYKGIYDENLEFVRLEKIDIVASMTPASVVGRHEITSRFTANVNIVYMDHPTQEDMETIYAYYLKTILQHSNFGGGEMAKSCKKIARFMQGTYEEIKQKFPPDEHRHYLITPREMTQWAFNFMRYQANDAEELVEFVVYEACRIFRDRLVDEESQQVFNSIVGNQLRTHLNYSQRSNDVIMINSGSEPINKNLPIMIPIERKDLDTVITDTLRSYE